ncbi:AAA family ATPase [Kordiimonas aquimaris]|uniref:AAA family ATPase n=1 Tax=Kordiimonas aquimaris TaxID=707591 RepID=UPI0021D2E737|nr:cellulose synthase operon protein YhjQ/BcsQ [Kordiimonas aquimaris]
MNALASSLEAAPSTRAPFAAFICDDTSSEMLNAIVETRGWDNSMVFAGGVAAAVRMLGGMPCPEFLIVDLAESKDARADMQALADVCEAGTLVLSIGTINDVTLYRDLIAAGVHDYLVKPLNTDALEDAIASAEAALATTDENTTPAEETTGTNVAFVGVRGGLGTSTIVTNIAWLLAERDQPTALLDLDLYFGTSAMQFDMEPGRGLADALDNPERVDGLFLERAVVKPHANLSILGAEAAVGSMPEPAEGVLHHLIQSLAENFTNVVVDIPRQVLGHHTDTLKAAKDIVLVTDYSLTAARDCIRLLAHIRLSAPTAKVHIVAIKGAAAGQEVNEKDFENSIEHTISSYIPFDAKATAQAAQQGKLVVDSAANSKLSAALKDIANLISPANPDASHKSGWLKKLMSKS